MKITFPPTFLWGTATAAHQVEGGNVYNDNWVLEHVPGTPYSEPSGDACDHYHRYRQDIALLAELGFTLYRFSLEWSRIEPEEGEFSLAELDHYRRMLTMCHEHGITPMVTFHHFTSPRWLAASGGWEVQETPEKFARFCERAMAHLGDLIPLACTLNEVNIGPLLTAIRVGGAARSEPWFEAAARTVGSDTSRFTPFLYARGGAGNMRGWTHHGDAGYPGGTRRLGDGRTHASGTARCLPGSDAGRRLYWCPDLLSPAVRPGWCPPARSGCRTHSDGRRVLAGGARIDDPVRECGDGSARHRNGKRHRHRRRHAADCIHRACAARRRCLPAKWNRRARLHLLVGPGQLRVDLRLSSDLRSHRGRSTHAATHDQAQCPLARKCRTGTRLLSERRDYDDGIASIHP